MARDRSAVSLFGPTATPQHELNASLATFLYQLSLRLLQLENEHTAGVYALVRLSIKVRLLRKTFWRFSHSYWAFVRTSRMGTRHLFSPCSKPYSGRSARSLPSCIESTLDRREEGWLGVLVSVYENSRKSWRLSRVRFWIVMTWVALAVHGKKNQIAPIPS